MLPDTRNGRIALAKGWTWQDVKWFAWHNPKGQLGTPPDYVGTLKGVAELMRELNPKTTIGGWRWNWGWDAQVKRYVCIRESPSRSHFDRCSSPEHVPGVCVGDAWLSVFGKERDVD